MLKNKQKSKETVLRKFRLIKKLLTKALKKAHQSSPVNQLIRLNQSTKKVPRQVIRQRK